jgi:hypothetical protein
VVPPLPVTEPGVPASVGSGAAPASATTDPTLPRGVIAPAGKHVPSTQNAVEPPDAPQSV